jgi:hypothetical protein
LRHYQNFCAVVSYNFPKICAVGSLLANIKHVCPNISFFHMIVSEWPGPLTDPDKEHDELNFDSWLKRIFTEEIMSNLC